MNVSLPRGTSPTSPKPSFFVQFPCSVSRCQLGTAPVEKPQGFFQILNPAAGAGASKGKKRRAELLLRAMPRSAPASHRPQELGERWSQASAPQQPLQSGAGVGSPPFVPVARCASTAETHRGGLGSKEGQRLTQYQPKNKGFDVQGSGRALLSSTRCKPQRSPVGNRMLPAPLNRRAPRSAAKSPAPSELRADADPHSTASIFHLAKLREGNCTRSMC